MLLTPSSLTWQDYIFKSWQVIQSPINNFKWCSTYYCVNVSPGIYPRVNGTKSLERQDQCLWDQEYLGVPKHSLWIQRLRVYKFLSPLCCPYCHWQTLQSWLAAGRLGLGTEKGTVTHCWHRTGKALVWATAGFNTVQRKTKNLSISSKIIKWSGLLMDKLE